MTVNLVTGGAGFVGRRLVAALKVRGESTRILDLASPANAGDIQGSVTDPNVVRSALRGVDVVFHLAGNAQLWAPRAQLFDEVNHRGARVVLEAAAIAGVRRVVHCSSLTTLVGRKTPHSPSTVDETHLIDPADTLGPYPQSKRRAEIAVEDMVRRGLDAVIAIPTEPLGAGDESLTPPTRMIMDIANGNIPAYIDCILNFVPADSLVEGLIAARDRGRKGQRYLFGGDNVSMSTLLAEITRITGAKTPKRRLPYMVAQLAGVIDTGIVSKITGKPPKAPLTGVRLAGRRVSFSSEKAARELNWRAAPFEPALVETLEWMKEAKLIV